jgi:hypothetical protein
MESADADWFLIVEAILFFVATVAPDEWWPVVIGAMKGLLLAMLAVA